jgi:hypothetical protein
MQKSVFGVERAKELSGVLIKESVTFSVEPYPDDEYMFSFPSHCNRSIEEQLSPVQTFLPQVLLGGLCTDELELPPGTVVTPTHCSDNWFLAEYDGYRFWFHSSQAKIVSG